MWRKSTRLARDENENAGQEKEKRDSLTIKKHTRNENEGGEKENNLSRL